MNETYKEYCNRVNIVPNKELVSIDELEVPVSLRRTISLRDMIIDLVKSNMSKGLSFIDSVYKVQDDSNNLLHEPKISMQAWIDSREVIVSLTENECDGYTILSKDKLDQINISSKGDVTNGVIKYL